MISGLVAGMPHVQVADMSAKVRTVAYIAPFFGRQKANDSYSEQPLVLHPLNPQSCCSRPPLAVPSQTIGAEAENQCTDYQRHGRDEKVAHHCWMIELLYILEPRCRPQPVECRAVPMHMVDSDTNRWNRWSPISAA
jgi:hypothetical protein